MSDTPPEGPVTDRREPVDLQEEIQKSYLDYAMSVIVGRALPDVRDGLKPVHRRVLYAMFDGGYRPDRGWNKCARIVGDVMGQYHPHGDSSIYDTLVRLAQPWVMRAPLINGQGNFGSPGNDSAAAMRYTECRMAPLAMEMVRDIEKETVDFQANYDGRSQEPVVLPARFPNLLTNGSAGIAVGMATNIAPHNLVEVIQALRHLVKHPKADLDALMRFVPGPDLPTGGKIIGLDGVRDLMAAPGEFTEQAITGAAASHGPRPVVVRPVLVHPTGFRMSPYADIKPAGEDSKVAARRAEGYRPREVIEGSPELRQAVDAVASGVFSPDDPHRYRGLMDGLREHDWFMVAADFDAYADAQARVDRWWGDRAAWDAACVRNVANVGWFSSDRTIREYARDIWGVM